eukprot:CAMPEP_0204157928 /NCGR_PEP_ID=MMETSP0361-20130328/31661_1 /ASSEMBLY_ACC=CAM_ASM_000343 /TAXON_ID=268821 /ORGANISM="Scrippsiella Hangoei, Strain SHTV-5" /LENGTH=72 /DNA_ID=CAMNT_0051113777 /DNA_START=56 /DNA_END=274 /DNA_ORIENTATION=-
MGRKSRSAYKSEQIRWYMWFVNDDAPSRSARDKVEAKSKTSSSPFFTQVASGSWRAARRSGEGLPQVTYQLC